MLFNRYTGRYAGRIVSAHWPSWIVDSGTGGPACQVRVTCRCSGRGEDHDTGIMWWSYAASVYDIVCPD